MKIVVREMQIRPGEPTNKSVLSAVEVLHEPQSVCEKDDAPENMRFMVVILDTSQFEISPLNDNAELNIFSVLFTLDISHLEMSPSNDDAEENISTMVVTPETSHLERSPLKDDAE